MWLLLHRPSARVSRPAPRVAACASRTCTHTNDAVGQVQSLRADSVLWLAARCPVPCPPPAATRAAPLRYSRLDSIPTFTPLPSLSSSLQPGQYVLFESASGYALFDVVEADEISALKAEVQASIADLAKFSKLVKLKGFQVRPQHCVV